MPNNEELAAINTKLSNGAKLVDVRSPSEYQEEYAMGALNVPLAQMQSGNFGQLSQDELIYVYCHSGARATLAKKLLNNAGYPNVINILSLDKWKAIGGEIQ